MKDLGLAFSFPFRDPSWISKFVIAALFMLLCIVGLGVFVLVGYMIQVTQRVMRRDELLLPEWKDVGVKFILGFKFAVVYGIYLLPVLLLLIPFFFLIIASLIAAPSDTAGLFVGVYAVGFAVIVVPYSLAVSLLMPIISYRFAATESIADALNIAAVLAEFRRHWQPTLIVALIAIGVESLAGIGLVAFIIGIFFTSFYAYLVSAYLHGALYLEAHRAEG